MTPGQPPHRIDPDAVLAEALRLAAQGWPVFPIVPGSKRPLTAHGMLDATTAPDRIRTWWTRHPTANLAIPTGRPTAELPGTVDVLDVDTRPDGNGFAAFNRLKRAGLLARYTRVVATPSGGVHVYFQPSDQPSGRLPDHHLDFKATGGYVLVPPSIVDGRPYELVRDRDVPAPADGLPGLDWAACRDLLAPQPSAFPGQHSRTATCRLPHERGGISVLAAWVARLPEGSRNTGTFWAACRAVEQGHTTPSDLAPIVDAAVQAGLPRREAERTVRSALRRLTPSDTGTLPTQNPTRANSASPGRARGAGA